MEPAPKSPRGVKATPSKLEKVLKVRAKKSIQAKKVSVPKTKKKPLTTILLREEKGAQRKKITIKNNCKPKQVSVIQKPVQALAKPMPTQLAVLSPFRLPLPRQYVVANVARVVGMFFVLFGGLSALFTMTNATNHELALVGGEQVATTLLTGTTTAQFQIQVDKASPLSGTVLIKVTGSNMQKVILRGKVAGLNYEIRDVKDHSTEQWVFSWDTPQFPDGQYYFSAYIDNGGASVVPVQLDTPYIVDNTQQSTTGTINYVTSSGGTSPSGGGTTTGVTGTETSTNTTTTTTTTTTLGDTTTDSGGTTTNTTTSLNTTTVPSVLLSLLEYSPLRGGVDMRVFVQNATKIALRARNVTTNAIYFVGYPSYQTGDEWRFQWDSTKVVDGNYVLSAHAQVDGKSYSGTTTASVDNVDEATVATTLENGTEATTTTTTTTSEIDLKPTIALRFSKESPVSGFMDVIVETSPVQWVEVYAQPKYSLTPLFLGMAQKVSETVWKYGWETKQTPNGEYNVYARVRTSYGFTEGAKRGIKIQNTILSTYTEEQESTIDSLSTVTNELVKVTDGTETKVVERESVELVETKTVYVQPVESFIADFDADEEVREEVDALLREFRMALDVKLNELARAMRADDADALTKAKADIEKLKNEIIGKVPTSVERKEMVDRINTYLAQVAFELQELTTKNETIIKERVGGAVLNDSDKDGISDYDEVNLYKTNPFTADTDGDGYTDGVEITKGFNPHDSSSEAFIAYESPKETGIVREDILVVTSLTSMESIEEEGEKRPQALISGKGLPNSFVTLYIYSTPVVVTVKTDEEGNWTYVLDKDLDEGEHEVYVGITDNEGRVVAKSSPLPFVKTAEAFTSTSIQPAFVADANLEPSLLSRSVMLLVASVSVVALGLVLILLGIHVQPKNKEEELIPAVS